MTDIAGYVRVSTTEQNLDRQLERIAAYASRTFDIYKADIDVFRDRSTGTDVARDG